MTKSEKHTQWYRTKRGLVSTIYSAQKRKSKSRCMKPPVYSKEDLQDWLYSQTKFHTLYDGYKESVYCSRKRPSVDRLDDNKSYSFDNIELTTWEVNQQRAYENIRKGKIDRHITIPVSQYSIAGEHIANYVSFKEASRETGVDDYSIALCAKGLKNKKHAGGFLWKLIG